MRFKYRKTAAGQWTSGYRPSKLWSVVAFLLTVLLVNGSSAIADTGKKKTDSGDMVSRKLVTSYHLTCVEKQDEDRYYEEWVNASYDGQGHITHKEILRETSKEYGGWNGEVTYSLDFKYSKSGRLSKISGTEGDWGAASHAELPVEWEIAYSKNGKKSRADGTERSDPRHIYDTYDGDGNLIARDYLIRGGQALDIGTLSLSYDEEGRVTRQSCESSKASLSSGGQPSSKMSYDMSVGYDRENRIASIDAYDSDGKKVNGYTYEYDDEGRLTRRSRYLNGEEHSQTYAYDKSGHLASVDGNATHATFVTDDDGSIISARIETDYDVQEYEIEYVTKKTPRGQVPVNAVDLTDPTHPELYSELWVSHASSGPTPFDEAEFLRENRRWRELHEVASSEDSSKQDSTGTTNASNGEKPSNKYESVLKEYRDGLNSDTQPSYETINLEAWAARDRNRDRYAYALYDLNGDGSEELLIGIEEDAPVSEGGLDVNYRLYDLFTIVNNKPTRVLDSEKMGSLGYRAFCIPCENGVLVTGGSGGANYHVCEYWKMGKKANELALLCGVVVDGGSYTFTNDSGDSETLTGEEAIAKYAGIAAGYTPIASFDWRLLNADA